MLYKPTSFVKRFVIVIVIFFSVNIQSPLISKAANSTAEFVVSTAGNDSNTGTFDKPFATLERARDAIRELKQKSAFPTSGVTVLIRGGIYSLSKTFELNEKDAGTENAPIMYRPYNHEEVHLIGGKEIMGFTPVSDPAVLNRFDSTVRDKVLQINLKTKEITDFGEIKARGFARGGIVAALELYFQNRPMTLARWPNTDWAEIVSTPFGPQGDKFTYFEDRPNRWTKAEDVWLHGFWSKDWADSFVKISSIKTGSHEIVTQKPHGVYGYKAGGRYYAINILEELDEPGEWYLDRNTGILYFWPPAPLTHGKTFVSILPTIISLQNTSYVTIQGITIEYCRGTAVKVINGSHNLIAGCTLRNVGTDALKFDGGFHNGVLGCDIYHCGESGIRLGGGDRNKLLSAGNFAINNCIHDFCQWVRTNNPGIAIDGVGNRVANNLIYNAPDSAILLHGNEHIVEYNEIHHVCMETSDTGAFYMGRDFSERGNTVRFNYFHDLGTADVQAIYLDDFASGTTVYGNVVYKAGRGVLIGGGRDNVIQNNMFVESGRHSIHLDARGIGWARKFFDGSDTTLTDRLKAVNFKQPPYSTRYPRLVGLYDGKPALPEGNVIINNISYKSNWLDLANWLTVKDITLSGNLTVGEPGFVDYARKNFQLNDSSPAFKMGFQRIPMEKIGIYRDKYRKSLD